ncbi:CF206 protein, partial [Rhinopomastus cyanomelas]|nr:CF206 protein [Rhinopomastus cyanomelas]
MESSHTDRIIRRIVGSIEQACAARGQDVSEAMVLFAVQAVILDPRNDLTLGKFFTEEDLQNLIQLCIRKLLDTTNPSLSTMKMQVYFDTTYKTRDELLHEQHRVLEEKLAPVVRDITTSCPHVQEDVENTYHNILSYMLLSSDLGSPRDIEVVRETTAALQSVFPETEMPGFMSLSKKNKEQQLRHLAKLVAGIRLYNKECGKGGRTIDDWPTILNEAISSATQAIEERLHTCYTLAHQYTALLESMQEDPRRRMQLSDFKIKEALFNVRQYERSLCMILSDVITSAEEVEKLRMQFAEMMEQLKQTVHKFSVDTSEAHPFFVALADLWSHFQDEMLLLRFCTSMTDHLQQFVEIQSQLFPEEVLTSLLERVTVKTDEKRRRETMETRVNAADFQNQEWLFPDTTENLYDLPIQYHAFCAYTIGAKGYLVPGNPAIGILKHREKCYVFSSVEAAYSFAQDPDMFIQLIIEKAWEYAELVYLLGLHHDFDCLVPQAAYVDNQLRRPMPKRDSSTQTDTHLLPPTIVASYEWNEWELRRKAIKLANLRLKSTHSVQTDVRHMRRGNSTQVYLPKDNGTQTKHDNSSNVPRQQIFFKRVQRGSSPTTPIVKIDLTRAIDET